MNALVTGEKPEMKANEWSPFSVKHMTSAVVVAERALDAAKGYALAQHSAAQRALALQLVMLAAALAPDHRHHDGRDPPHHPSAA